MLSLISSLEQHFAKFTSEVLEGGVLEERDTAIAILAASYAMEDAEAVRRAIVAAKQVGVSNEEIGHISAIVIALRGQKIAALGQATGPARSSGEQSTCCR